MLFHSRYFFGNLIFLKLQKCYITEHVWHPLVLAFLGIMIVCDGLWATFSKSDAVVSKVGSTIKAYHVEDYGKHLLNCFECGTYASNCCLVKINMTHNLVYTAFNSSALVCIRCNFRRIEYAVNKRVLACGARRQAWKTFKSVRSTQIFTWVMPDFIRSFDSEDFLSFFASSSSRMTLSAAHWRAVAVSCAAVSASAVRLFSA